MCLGRLSRKCIRGSDPEQRPDSDGRITCGQIGQLSEKCDNELLSSSLLREFGHGGRQARFKDRIILKCCHDHSRQKRKVFLVDLRAKEALISQRRRRRFLICKLHFELDANMPFSIFGGNLVLKYRLSDVGPILPRLATFAVRPRVIYLASRRLNPRLSRPCISESEWSRAARAHSLNNHA